MCSSSLEESGSRVNVHGAASEYVEVDMLSQLETPQTLTVNDGLHTLPFVL